MKILFSLILLIFLSACGAVQNKEETTSEIHYVFPPSSLTQECYPDKPAIPSIDNIILVQKRAIDQCNDQLEGIRNYVDRFDKENTK